jgi:hypothetical protein
MARGKQVKAEWPPIKVMRDPQEETYEVVLGGLESAPYESVGLEFRTYVPARQLLEELKGEVEELRLAAIQAVQPEGYRLTEAAANRLTQIIDKYTEALANE